MCIRDSAPTVRRVPGRARPRRTPRGHRPEWQWRTRPGDLPRRLAGGRLHHPVRAASGSRAQRALPGGDRVPRDRGRDHRAVAGCLSTHEMGLLDGADAVLFDLDDTLLDYSTAVSYTHLRAHETVLDLVCRLLLEKK